MVPPPDRSNVFIDDYKAEVLQSMQEAWELARKNIGSEQKKQKRNCDRRSRKPTFQVRGRVFLYSPQPNLDQDTSLLYHTKEHNGTLKFQKMLHAIGQSGPDILRVAVDRLRDCPDECRPDYESHDIHTNHTEAVDPLPQGPRRR